MRTTSSGPHSNLSLCHASLRRRFCQNLGRYAGKSKRISRRCGRPCHDYASLDFCLGGGVEKDSPLQACEPYLDLACLNPCRHCLSQWLSTRGKDPFLMRAANHPTRLFFGQDSRADSSEGSRCCCRSSGATDDDNDGVAQAAISASLPVPLEVR